MINLLALKSFKFFLKPVVLVPFLLLVMVLTTVLVFKHTASRIEEEYRLDLEARLKAERVQISAAAYKAASDDLMRQLEADRAKLIELQKAYDRANARAARLQRQLNDLELELKTEAIPAETSVKVNATQEQLIEALQSLNNRLSGYENSSK